MEYFGSVIIPAYNEEKSIADLLKRISKPVDGRVFEIIVVCNGCVDQTFEEAINAKTSAKVLNLKEGSKTLALNEGDRHASHFPRIYLDADVQTEATDLAKVVNYLDASGKLACGANRVFDLSKSSLLVKTFYDVWSLLPYSREIQNIGGGGLYALTKLGRERFETFPKIIADDHYINRLFGSEEKGRQIDANVHIKAPLDVTSLIKIKSRAYQGSQELNKLMKKSSSSNSKGSILGLFKERPEKSIQIVLYVCIQILARLHAKFIQPFSSQQWQRDLSTR